MVMVMVMVIVMVMVTVMVMVVVVVMAMVISVMVIPFVMKRHTANTKYTTVVALPYDDWNAHSAPDCKLQ